MIVRQIAETNDKGHVSTSTEEVIHKIEEYNKSRSEKNLKKIIIASMDVEKGYPNILSKESAQIIRKMFEESELVIDGIEVESLCRYLGKYLKREEVIEEGFEDLLYTKKKNTKKATKKISKRHVKKKVMKKVKKKTKDRVKDIRDILDTSSSEGADTLEAAAKDEENETQNIRTKKSEENNDNASL